MAHKTRAWSAIESTDFAGGSRKLTVSGEVETLSTNQVPALAAAKPQGINPTALLLELTVSTSGIGGQIVQWRPVVFVHSVSQHQYHDVTVIDGEQTHAIKVRAVAS